MSTHTTVANWNEAAAQIRAIAAAAGITEILFGTGYAYRKPHVLAVANDAEHGPMGYSVSVYPKGDGGHNSGLPCTRHTVTIA